MLSASLTAPVMDILRGLLPVPLLAELPDAFLLVSIVSSSLLLSKLYSISLIPPIDRRRLILPPPWPLLRLLEILIVLLHMSISWISTATNASSSSFFCCFFSCCCLFFCCLVSTREGVLSEAEDDTDDDDDLVELDFWLRPLLNMPMEV